MIKFFSYLILIVLNLAPGLLKAEILTEGKPDFSGELRRSESTLPDFKLLAKELSPAVVNIAVEVDGDGTEQVPGLDFLNPEGDSSLRSLGSGFVVSKDGYVVTNNHVIENSKRIVVRLLDDKGEYDAVLIGRDEETDLALLKIEPGKELAYTVGGDSSHLEVGEWVLAIGNQFQLGQTVTAGIVSAKSRRVPGKSGGRYDHFIQTDASINPGSSGGPLFNSKGQVIGINTAIFSPGRSSMGGSGFNIGIGFAIPINMARGILTQLKQRGKVVRGLLGVVIQNVSSDMAEALELDSAAGALVSEVISGSPAALAGIQIQDVIVEYNGMAIDDHDELPLLVASTPVNSEVEVRIVRNGKKKIVLPVITELRAEALKRNIEIKEPEPDLIGIVTEDISESIADSLGLESEDGVIVVSVEPGSAAFKAGIVRGDLLLEIGSAKIKDGKALRKIEDSLLREKPVLILVRRREGYRFLTLKLPVSMTR